jgi:hypothetical protein
MGEAMSKYRWLGAGLAGLLLSACADDVVRFDDSLLLGSPAPQASGGSMTSTGGGAGSGGAASVSPTPVGGEPSAAGSATQPEAGVAGAGDGGAGGEAGAPPNPIASPILDLIDEVELGFPALPVRAGRNGAWFSVHDETGGFVEPLAALLLEPARGTSHFAARLGGGGFTAWGAQLGVSLQSAGTGYDASGSCGLHFVAKGRGEGWTLLISDRLSSPKGSVCDPNASEPSRGCYDHPGKAFAPSADWQTYDIDFEELRPFKGFSGTDRPLERAALFDVVFNFENPNGAAFELLVDDLAFVPCAGT